MSESRPLEGFTALVLDSEAKCAPAVVRSLGRNGARVLAAAGTLRTVPAQRSRYVTARLAHPHALHDRAGLTDWVLDAIEARHPDVVLPLTEYTVRTLDGARAAFEGRARIALPPADPLQVCFDKDRLLALAESVGIAVPRTWRPATFGEAAALAGSLPYPVYIKARQSYDFRTQRPRFARGGFVRDAASFAPAYRVVHEISPLPLIQEAVRGTVCSVAGVWQSGACRAIFANAEDRMWPISGGFGVMRRALPPHGPLADAANVLLRELSWTGVAEAEFVQDGDRQPILMEVNGRFWGSVDFAQYCGVDVTLEVVRTALGLAPPATYAPYVPGRKARWIEGDLKRAFVAWAQRDASALGALRVPGRLETLRDLVWGFRPGVHQDDFYTDDPLPFLALVARTVALARRAGDAGEP